MGLDQSHLQRAIDATSFNCTLCSEYFELSDTRRVKDHLLKHLFIDHNIFYTKRMIDLDICSKESIEIITDRFFKTIDEIIFDRQCLMCDEKMAKSTETEFLFAHLFKEHNISVYYELIDIKWSNLTVLNEVLCGFFARKPVFSKYSNHKLQYEKDERRRGLQVYEEFKTKHNKNGRVNKKRNFNFSCNMCKSFQNMEVSYYHIEPILKHMAERHNFDFAHYMREVFDHEYLLEAVLKDHFNISSVLVRESMYECKNGCFKNGKKVTFEKETDSSDYQDLFWHLYECHGVRFANFFPELKDDICTRHQFRTDSNTNDYLSSATSTSSSDSE